MSSAIPTLSDLRPNPLWSELPLFDRTGWRRVRFGDVVENCNETCNPAEAGLERFVAMEHLEPGSLHVRSWGNVADGTTFTRRCRPGQVLFGKRRAYQRKVAVAEFEAVVSGDIYVLAPRDTERLLPELLPFLCLSERFFQHAVGTSAGSLSPRTNWSSLASFEFDLPPLDQQRRIAEILWAVDEVISSAQDTAMALDEFVRVRIAEAMGNGAAKSTTKTHETPLGRLPVGWVAPTLREVCSVISDGVHKKPNYVERGIPFITVKNLTRAPGISFEDVNYISEADHNEFTKRTRPERGDVLLTKDGATLGVPRVIETDAPFSIFVSVALLKPDYTRLDPYYLCYGLESPILGGRLIKNQTGSAIRHIHLIDLRSARIPLPPLREQKRFVQAVRLAEANSAAQRSHLERLNELAAALRGAVFS